MLVICVVFGELLEDRLHDEATMGLRSVKTRLNIDAFLLFVSDGTRFAPSSYSNLINIQPSHTLSNYLLSIMDFSIGYFEIFRLIISATVPKMVFEFSAALILVFDEVDFEFISLEIHLLLGNFLDLVLLESEVVQISVVACTATRETKHIFSYQFLIALPFELEHLLMGAAHV
jgi:hypothetical protein